MSVSVSGRPASSPGAQTDIAGAKTKAFVLLALCFAGFHEAGGLLPALLPLHQPSVFAWPFSVTIGLRVPSLRGVLSSMTFFISYKIYLQVETG